VFTNEPTNRCGTTTPHARSTARQPLRHNTVPQHVPATPPQGHRST
jgi:hypothetical protein